MNTEYFLYIGNSTQEPASKLTIFGANSEKRANKRPGRLPPSYHQPPCISFRVLFMRDVAIPQKGSFLAGYNRGE